MANVSSVHGTLYFKTKDKPWTVDGFKAAIYILKSQDSSTGNYGFAFTDDDTLDELLAKHSIDIVVGNEVTLSFWGSGRWSFYNNLNSFSKWSETQTTLKDYVLPEDTYQRLRTALAKTMHANGWYFDFEYYEEEAGVGFIDYSGHQIHGDPSGEYTSIVGHTVEYEHNLHNYITVYSDDYVDAYVEDIIDSYIRLLRVPKRQHDIFREFILNENIASTLSVAEAEYVDDATIKRIRKEYKQFKIDNDIK